MQEAAEDGAMDPVNGIDGFIEQHVRWGVISSTNCLKFHLWKMSLGDREEVVVLLIYAI